MTKLTIPRRATTSIVRRIGSAATRVIATALLLSGTALACTTASAQVIVAPMAPPALRAEVVPPPRAGYVWDRGHWRWEAGRYVWVPGHWQPVRVGFHWVPGHWARRGPGWRWIEGHWAP